MQAETAIDIISRKGAAGRQCVMVHWANRTPARAAGVSSTPTLETSADAESSCYDAKIFLRVIAPRIFLAQALPKTKVPLVPPKPNEFFTAMSIFISRAVLAQKSRSQAGSWLKRLIVGGEIW